MITHFFRIFKYRTEKMRKMISESPFFESFYKHSRYKTDNRTRNRAADKQYGQISYYSHGFRPQNGGNDLSYIVEYTADNADGNRRKPIGLL